MAMNNWVILPTAWIEQGGLKNFRWAKTEGSSAIAALMTLAVIAHTADERGSARITYDCIAEATGLSRTKIANGLNLLAERNVIQRSKENQSVYCLSNYDRTKAWGKLPAKPLYGGGAITAFKEFHLRKITELDSLKAYFVIITRRDNRTNLANITYDKIEQMTGIERRRIKSALSFLVVNNLVQIDHVPSRFSEYGVSNAYRPSHLDRNNYMGTLGRRMMQEDGFTE